MKRWFLRAVPAVVLGAVAVGCQEKPELKFSEYGETIPCLPRVENLPDAFPYPAEVEERECHFYREAVENAKQKQGENEKKLIVKEKGTPVETAE